jgi:hypothetical protein
MKDWLLPPHIVTLRKAMSGNEPLAAMRPLLVELAAWLLPSRVQQLLLETVQRVGGPELSGNALLKNKHCASRRCFVIGNGPSLGDMDLSPLANELTIGANSFYMHPQADLVNLDYLTCGDASFFVDAPRSIEWHRTIERRLPNTTLVMNPGILALMRRHGVYRNHRVHVYQNGLKALHAEHVHFDFTRPLNVGVTTGSLLAIPLAIFLGAREIYLIGFDCNWLESYSGSYHFYKTHEIWKEFDSPAADPRTKGQYEVELAMALREFRAHAMIAERTRQLGIRVINATRGGRLDTYPRVRYEELFPTEHASEGAKTAAPV